MSEPKSITAGQNAGWMAPSRVIASSSYDYRYRFMGPKSFDVVAQVIEGRVVVDLLSPDTAAFTAGAYKWVLIQSKDGNQETLSEGFTTIHANPDSLTAFDSLTYNEKMYELIKSKLLGRANTDYQRYSIDGRSMDRIPVLELEQLKNRYARLARLDKIAKGQRKPHKRIRYI